MRKTKYDRAQSDREEIARLKDGIERSDEESRRHYVALEGLMRAVLLFVAGESSIPTSINSAKLIAAVEQASRTIHMGVVSGLQKATHD